MPICMCTWASSSYLFFLFFSFFSFFFFLCSKYRCLFFFFPRKMSSVPLSIMVVQPKHELSVYFPRIIRLWTARPMNFVSHLDPRPPTIKLPSTFFFSRQHCLFFSFFLFFSLSFFFFFFYFFYFLGLGVPLTLLQPRRDFFFFLIDMISFWDIFFFYVF